MKLLEQCIAIGEQNALLVLRWDQGWNLVVIEISVVHVVEYVVTFVLTNCI
jgi:hypothetical protein